MRQLLGVLAILSTVLIVLGSSYVDRYAQAREAAEGRTHGSRAIERHESQTLYVPVYAHIYYFNRNRRFNLATTLSIRNTDLDHPLTLTSVKYYDSRGALLQDYLPQPLRMDPLTSVDYVVDERDGRGGSGASFLVEWKAEQALTAPVVEAVMISSGTQGVSFVSPGRVIRQPSR